MFSALASVNTTKIICDIEKVTVNSGLNLIIAGLAALVFVAIASDFCKIRFNRNFVISLHKLMLFIGPALIIFGKLVSLANKR